MKATEQFFAVVLFIMLYKVVRTFDFDLQITAVISLACMAQQVLFQHALLSCNIKANIVDR